VGDRRSSSVPGGPHEQHDPELIAGLLDRDQPSADRVAALARTATCTDCAALHRDLLALASATVALPTPARPREFTLTHDVAAALTRPPAGEPVPARARLTGKMPDRLPPTAAHATHDRLLIANLADRSVSETERTRAELQMAACHDCRQLHDDLVSIREATRALPVPLRPREFTLSAADADRLRARGWRRILAAFGSSRDIFSRPLALGLTTLGLAGLLVATIPGAFTGQPTGGAATTSLGRASDAAAGAAGANPEALVQASAAPSAATTGTAAAQAAPAPVASGVSDGSTESVEPDRLFVGVGESGPLAGEPVGQPPFDLYGNTLRSEAPMGPSPLILVALLLLLVGLGLFALRWMSRRLGGA
jgi:hypothetical protein